MTEVIVHQVPTFFVEYRGWSQEVNIHHCEFTEPGKRFEARGRHTPYDQTRSLSTFGDDAYEAIQKFESMLASAPYDVHYKSINDEFLYLRGETERLNAALTEKAKQITPVITRRKKQRKKKINRRPAKVKTLLRARKKTRKPIRTTSAKKKTK